MYVTKVMVVGCLFDLSLAAARYLGKILWGHPTPLHKGLALCTPFHQWQ
jgi:hypothetical protein